MAQEQASVIVACPGCGKRFKLKHPGVAGVRTYACTGCGKKFNVNFKAPAAPQAPQPPQAPRIQAARLGAVIANLSSGAQANTPPAAAAAPKKTIMAGNFNGGWTVVNEPARATLKVVMRRRLLPAATKTFNINGYGVWTIGRYDSGSPTDIAIIGDDSMSRHCASIEAIPAPAGTTYLLRVLKTRNPIFINSRPMATGESIQLQNGDTIKMGKTMMTFSTKS